MSVRKRPRTGAKESAAAPPANGSRGPAPPPDPRRPHRFLLVCSGILFAAWLVVLIRLAVPS